MKLPVDLADFLKSGLQLEYEADACEVGGIRLLGFDQLRLKRFPTDIDNSQLGNVGDPHQGEYGCYLVPAVNLVAHCDEFDPDGLLLWLPNENCYGTWDSSHTLIEAFSPKISWSDIASNPIPYLNSFRHDEDVGFGGLRPLIPWPQYEYDPVQRTSLRPLH
jgi:hypothetical protein